MYNFKEEKTDFEKTENEIIQSIIDSGTFPLQKTENDYVEPQRQTKQDYLQTALEFNKADLMTAKENLEKRV